MTNTKTNIIVKKLLKKKGKILHIDEIKKLIEDLDKKAVYKQIYHLKNKGILLSLKKDLFFIKDPNLEITQEEIIEQIYWKLLKDYTKSNFWQKYFIWWVKALEIWNNNYSIPDKITIVNPYKKSKTILLSWKEIQNTTYNIKWLTPEDSFKKFKKFTEKFLIDNKNFIVANYELSLLESLYNLSFEEEKYVYEIIKKNIRKNYKRINTETFEYFLKLGKYSQSCKKLYQISLTIRPDFAEKLRKIILKWSYL